MRLCRIGPEAWAAFRDLRVEMLTREDAAFASAPASWARKSEGEVRNWLREAYALGLYDGQDLAGSAAYFRTPDGPNAPRAQVVGVYLRPEVRGQGHMTRLLIALADAARGQGLSHLVLDVGAGNVPAIATYRRAGFVQAHSQTSRDTLVFERALSPP